MTTVYLESSALLAYLFKEKNCHAIQRSLEGAVQVITSVLTLVEAERAVSRLQFQSIVNAAQALSLAGILVALSNQWIMMEMTSPIRKRAGGLFPVEPVRSLDAIHLATMLEAIKSFPDLQVESCDERILSNLEPLGLTRSTPV